MLDAEILRIIWWALIGVLLSGFAIFDGFDFGTAMLLPLIAKNETEREIVLNTIEPFWEGNQVWIILGAGAIFAAWPTVYAVAFSGFYLLMLLLLLTMGISRPVSFKYRSKLPNMFWRRFWDWIVFIGGLFPAFIFGVLIGNVLEGVPFNFDESLRISYTGSLLNLFNPFSLWCGVLSIAMLIMHGGLYLAIKTYAPIRDRAIFWSRWMSLVVILFFAIGGVWVAQGIMGYEVISQVDPNGFSNPLHKQVMLKLGGWIENYVRYPKTITLPVLGLLGALLSCLTARWGNARFAFVCSSVSLIGIIGTVGVSMFPFILPSSSDFASSLLVWDASSSGLTLLVMLFAVLIFMPIILLYTSWVYRALRGKVSQQDEHTGSQPY